MTTVEITSEVRRRQFNRTYLSNGMWIIEDLAHHRGNRYSLWRSGTTRPRKVGADNQIRRLLELAQETR